MKCRFNPDKKNIGIEFRDGQSIDIEQHWDKETDLKRLPLETQMMKSARELPFPSATLEWSEQCKSENLLFEYSLTSMINPLAAEGQYLSFSVTVTNSGHDTRCLHLQQKISGLPLGGKMFAPSAKGIYEMTKAKKNAPVVGYRAAHDFDDCFLSIPMVSFLEEADDIGYTFCAHIEMPVPPFICRVDGSQVLLERKVLDLRPGESRTVRHYLIRHTGCWRSGLAWVREKFSKFFMLADNALAEKTHGCFIYSNVADKKLCDQFVKEGVKDLEIHFTLPFFGKYVPEEEAWIPMLDDKWNAIKKTTDPAAPAEDAPYQDIKRYMSGVVKANMTKARVAEFIHRLKSLGIQSFIYFMPTEGWEFFVRWEYPEAVYRNTDGSPSVTWKDHNQLNSSPQTRWGHYICRQLEGLLDMYPEVDGIFMDQSALDRNDYTVCQITDRLAKIAAERGKLCYWNGPYLVELIEHAVGMVAESGPMGGGIDKVLDHRQQGLLWIGFF